MTIDGIPQGGTPALSLRQARSVFAPFALSKPGRAALLVAVLLTALALPSHAFVCLRSSSGACLHWGSGGTTLRTLLGPSRRVLMNGTLTFDQNAIGAAADWNAVGAGFGFNVVVAGSAGDPCSCPSSNPPGDNPVMFSSSACGGGFGDVVAETQTCFDRESGELVNAAVFMNSSATWDAYDGPLIFPINDIRRVLLHEFGHVLGLAHPDDFGQAVVAIMNSQESNVYRLQADDVDGLFFLYGDGPLSSGGGSSDGNTCAIVTDRPPRGNGWFWMTVGLAALVARLRRMQRR